MDWQWVPIVVAVGLVIVGGYVAQALGKTREQRIADLREELRDERELSDRRISALREEVNELRERLATERARVDVLTGDFAHKVGQTAAPIIADQVISRLKEAG